MVAYAGGKTLQIMQQMFPDAAKAGIGPYSPTGPSLVQGGPGSLAAHYDSVPYQSTHNTGGAIMGADPGTSVVNSYLQMWEYDNTWVVGGSAFPYNSSHPPTGTIGALAFRAAEGIVRRYMHRQGPLV